MADESLRVEVAYAIPGTQWLIELDVPPGTTAGEAIRLSGIVDQLPDIDTTSIGVFGESVKHDHRLRPGDRVEIYRPLTADPREARRELAKLGRSMSRR